ncbi:MAG: AAA family ATPase [Clostridia bacterium]|nr:AAA family ATPase [Clostridia bacterium]
MTAEEVSVGADTRQSPISTSDIIADYDDFCNTDEEEFFIDPRKLDPRYIETVTMQGLLDTAFTPRLPIIEGFLYPGTYLMAGSPKIGKSFLVTQIGYSIATGTPLWGMPVQKGSVLYLALEDDRQRLQRRVSRMFGVEGTAALHFATQARSVENGLMQQLEGFIREHSDTKLIIIDTLQKVRGDEGEKYSYANDYQIISSLKALTDANPIAILIVHHTRKQDADDKFDTISGTTGLLGSADGAFLLRKEKRTSPEATLDVVGRDQQDLRFKLLFSYETCTFDLTETETELWKDPPDPTLDAVAALVNAETPLWEGSPTELALRIGGGLKPHHLSRKLNVNVARLLAEHGVLYAPFRTHDSRMIRLFYRGGTEGR